MVVKQNYYVFLDDYRIPQDVQWVKLPDCNWTIVRSYEQFVNLIKDKGYLPSFISYDHDLADAHYQPFFNEKNIDYSKYKEKTGYDCAKWVVEFCQNLNVEHPNYLVHSMNPVGKVNIETYIKNYNKSI